MVYSVVSAMLMSVPGKSEEVLRSGRCVLMIPESRRVEGDHVHF